MEDDEVKEILDSYLNAEAFWQEHFDVEIIDYHNCKKIPKDNASKILKAKCLFSNLGGFATLLKTPFRPKSNLVKRYTRG